MLLVVAYTSALASLFLFIGVEDNSIPRESSKMACPYIFIVGFLLVKSRLFDLLLIFCEKVVFAQCGSSSVYWNINLKSDSKLMRDGMGLVSLSLLLPRVIFCYFS